MSSHVRKHYPLVELITSGISKKQLTAILETLSNEQLGLLGEIALNTIYSVLPLTKSQIGALKKYTSKLEFISDKKNSLAKRKAVIVRNPKLIELLLKSVKQYLKP